MIETPGDESRRQRMIDSILADHYITPSQAAACADAYALFEERPVALANAVNSRLPSHLSSSPSYFARPDHLICMAHYISCLNLDMTKSLDFSLGSSGSRDNYLRESDDLLRGSCLDWYGMFPELDVDEDDPEGSVFAFPDALDELVFHYVNINTHDTYSDDALIAEEIAVPLFFSMVDRGSIELSERAYLVANEQFREHLAGVGTFLDFSSSFYSRAESHYKNLVFMCYMDPMEGILRLGKCPVDDTAENRRKLIGDYVTQQLLLEEFRGDGYTSYTFDEFQSLVLHRAREQNKLGQQTNCPSLIVQSQGVQRIASWLPEHATLVESLLTK